MRFPFLPSKGNRLPEKQFGEEEQPFFKSAFEGYANRRTGCAISCAVTEFSRSTARLIASD